MKPAENTETENDDPRFSMLLKVLGDYKDSENHALHLHFWLSTQVNKRMFDQAIERTFDSQNNSDQIAICTKLEKAASLIAEQFDFLNQLSSLDYSLFQAYRSAKQIDTETHGSTKVEWPEKWRAFRDRLRSDTALLSQIACQTRDALKARGGKRGRPDMDWRDGLFIELRDQVSELIATTRKQRLEITKSLWNLYFPSAKVMEITAALQFIQRRRKASKK